MTYISATSSSFAREFPFAKDQGTELLAFRNILDASQDPRSTRRSAWFCQQRRRKRDVTALKFFFQQLQLDFRRHVSRYEVGRLNSSRPSTQIKLLFATEGPKASASPSQTLGAEGHLTVDSQRLKIHKIRESQYYKNTQKHKEITHTHTLHAQKYKK